MQFEIALPLIVDAVQWRDGTFTDEAPAWLTTALEKELGSENSVLRLGGYLIQVFTHDGPVVLQSTDWISFDSEGNLWTWTDSDFRAAFVPVDTTNFAVKTRLDWESYDKAHSR